MDRLIVLGLSHKTAGVALRERLAFREEAIPHALELLLNRTGCREAVILSTCNRVELYAAGEGAAEALVAKLRAFLAEFHAVAESEFAASLYSWSDAEAIRHLFEVAASIDSLVLGETEILGQAREAYRRAAEAGAAGPILRAVFERAFFVAKELRTESEIGRAQASIGSAAVKLAEKIFEGLGGHKVLVVGTGEMAASIVRALRGAGLHDFLVAGRTEERAQEFARREGGRSCRMENLPHHLKEADIVLVSAAAPHYILRQEELSAARAERHGRPLFLIDISVPRNVDPEVHRLPDTYLYDIDDLEEVAQEGRRQRAQAAERWQPRLAEEARALLNELGQSEPGSAARQLLAKAEYLRQAELEELRRSAALDPQTAQRLEQALDRFQARLLHGTLSTLKEAARAGDGAAAAQWVSRLFRLESKESGEAKESEESREL